jgi:tRNA pseudouridine55 synthase
MRCLTIPRSKAISISRGKSEAEALGRRKKGNRVHGWVFLDKPLGMGSTQAVSMVRRAFNAQKAGHAGTLDPLATGLLAIALGEATKTVPWMMEANKTYTFSVRWGEETTTCDVEGEICSMSPIRPSREQVEQTLAAFTGEIEQAPPAYSAIKIAGVRAYNLARAGKRVEMVERRVTVSQLKLLDCPDVDHASFMVSCGKGTYVRSLARDLARALGTCGHVIDLRRIAIGGSTIDQCIQADVLNHPDQLAGILHPLDAVLGHLVAIELDESQAASARHGNAVVHLDPGSPDPGVVDALLKFAGKPVCLATRQGDLLRPHRVFNLDEHEPDGKTPPDFSSGA